MEIVRIQGEHNRQQGVYYEYDRHSIPLGEGGMGRIYQGFRVEEYSGGMRIPVAIKEINEEISRNPQVIERAARESSIQIDHENLLRMYDFVENHEYLPLHDSHIVRYYMIMERIVGVNLDQVLSGNFYDKSGMMIPLAQYIYDEYNTNKENAVAYILKAVLSGLMALHDRGYIHRDIDPSNIMVTLDGKVKLIDFGVCKRIGTVGAEKQLTSAGSFLGKVNYAAPELALGDVNLQNGTTDIYALGILTYQLLVGKMPFTGSNHEVLKQQVNSKLPLKDIKHKGLRKIVEKATEKKQEKRYATAAEMIVAIDNAMREKTHVPTHSGGTTAGNGLISVEKSLPIWFWPASAVAGLVVGLIVGWVI